MGKNWEEIAEKIIKKETTVVARNKGKIPYTAKNHVFDDKSDKKDICWWTNGFYGGTLWQLYKATNDDLFKECAIELEDKLDAAFMDYNGMDHDAGFRWLPTSVANYRLFQGKESKNRALLAAANLAGRFNLNGNFIRAWNDWGDDRDTTGWAIIDCMMNLPLLYWASDELGDPRFKAIAVAHADTAMKNFIREDGSVRHIVGFDPETGEFDRDYGGQGYGEGSSWTRGQTWALYGFTLSYIHTGEKRYLETAIKVADRFAERIPEDGLIPVDFDQPKEPRYIDSTAAAIASCGFITLAKVLSGDTEDDSVVLGNNSKSESDMKAAVDKCLSESDRKEAVDKCLSESDMKVAVDKCLSESDRKAAVDKCLSESGSKAALDKFLSDSERAALSEKYMAAAEKMLSALDELDCDYDPEHDELLTRCTASYHDDKHEFPIIYGDYYYIEAIWKLTGRELFIW